MSNSTISMKKVGSVLELQRGYDLPTRSRVAGEIPIISSSGYSGYHDEFKCDGENVITGRYGTIGNVYYYNGKCWPLNTSLYVKDFKGNIPKYIYYFLKNTLKLYQVNGNDKSAVPGIDRKIIHEMCVPFHEDTDYQKDICSVLSCLDHKITTNSNICSEMEAMAKTIYDYWFVQFDFPDENGKPYRTSGGEMVWNEQLKREIPKGWEVSTVGKTIDKIPNTARIPSSEYLRDGSIPIIDQSSDFIAGYTNNPDSVLKSKSGYIVFGDHTRIVKYIRFPFARGADGTQVLKSNNPCIPEELFYQMIKSIDLSNYGYARHFKFLKDTLIVIPEKNISGNFAEITKPIYEKQAKLVFENIELSKLRDWLLPLLMNGQARVK